MPCASCCAMSSWPWRCRWQSSSLSDKGRGEPREYAVLATPKDGIDDMIEALTRTLEWQGFRFNHKKTVRASASGPWRTRTEIRNSGG
eukprot:71449-Amphidinium_carterae.2